ncbi:MAG: hypothetical protein KOO60_07670 [Gemmatimonadales bacterium]|nr:hypothetical protein [Gemmatimonadales bacterium]
MIDKILAWKGTRGRAIGSLALGLGGIALILGGVLPNWQKIRQNDKEIVQIQQSVASLGQWSAMGGWIEEGNLRLEPGLTERYDKLFPQEKDLSGLYLELAQLARSSGIEAFDLQEIQSTGKAVLLPDWVNPETERGAQMERLMGEVGGRFEDHPSSNLRSYRLRATFATKYSRLTVLLDALSTIDRALTISKLNVVQAPVGVAVNLEMDYYVQE